MPAKTAQPETQNTPNLRFAGFSGAPASTKAMAGNWEEKKLGEVAKIIDGDRGTNYPNGDDFSNDGYCLFLNAKNVTKRGFFFDEKSFITKEKDAQLRKGKLHRNDIVLTTRGSVGHVAFYNNQIPFENIRVNSGMVLVREEKKDIEPVFLYKFLTSKKVQNKIQRISFGSAQPQLTVKEINNLKIEFPSLPEQKKIADFLGAADAWIENLRAQKENFKSYKKGMMQKIFSQQIRFKDEKGKDFPAWEEKKLVEVAYTTTGSSNREDSTEEGDYTFFDRSEDIRASSQFLFDAEAVIVAGEGQEFRPKYFVGKFDLHQRTYAIMNFKNTVGKFIFYYVNYNRKYFNRVAVGSTVPSLRLPMFNKMPVSVPSFPEQQKIADFLTSVDKVIESKQQQITQAEQWKKGLMQGLFV